MVPSLRKSIKVWYSKAQFIGFGFKAFGVQRFGFPGKPVSRYSSGSRVWGLRPLLRHLRFSPVFHGPKSRAHLGSKKVRDCFSPVSLPDMSASTLTTTMINAPASATAVTTCMTVTAAAGSEAGCSSRHCCSCCSCFKQDDFALAVSQLRAAQFSLKVYPQTRPIHIQTTNHILVAEFISPQKCTHSVL